MRAFILILPLLAAPLPAQGRRFTPDLGRVVATSRFGTLRAGEFYRAVACRYGRDPRRCRALDQLIQVEIVRRELERAELEVQPERVTAKIEEIRRQAAREGKSLERRLRELNLDLETLRYFTWIGVGRRLLTARALECPPDRVTPSQEGLWLADQQQKVEVEKCLDRLEEGVAARVAGRPITTELYGWVLAASLATTQDDFQLHLVNSILSGRRIRELAREQGLEVTPTDRDREIARRRANVKADPRYHGATLDQLLEKTRGLTVERFSRSAPFTNHILLEKLTASRWPPEKQRAWLAKHRQRYLDHFGESRHLLHMLIPSEKEEEARKRAAALKEKIKGPRTFKLLAAWSTPKEKVRRGGCDLGFVHRAEKDVPPALLQAAFALEPGRVGGPYRTKQGFHLLMVTEIKPPPPEEELLAHVRRDLRQKLLRELLAEARIELAEAPGAEGKGK